MRNFYLEEKIINMLNSYRSKLPPQMRSWEKIAKSSKLSRNAVYDIIDSSKDVRRETVIFLALTLKMTLEDFVFLYNYKGFTLRPDFYHEQLIALLFEESIHNHRFFLRIQRVCEEEAEKRACDLLDRYKSVLSSIEDGWLAIAATVDLSRNAVYDIRDSNKDVRRDTVILLGFALEMTWKDFNALYNYKGFIYRPGIDRDEITREFFENGCYDHIEWAKRLIESGEEPPFNYDKPIK